MSGSGQKQATTTPNTRRDHQHKRTAPRRRSWLRGFLWLCLLVPGWQIGCGGPIPWKVAPSADNSCDLRAKLRDQKAYQEASAYDDPTQQAEFAATPALRSPYRTLFAEDRELGCLVLAEAGKVFVALSSIPVALSNVGAVKARNETSGKYDAAPQWKLSPGELKDKPLTLTLYVLKQNIFEEKDHPSICQNLIKQEPSCFSTDPTVKKTEVCWFFVKLSPEKSEDSPFQFASMEGGSCRVCSREICANGIDDDCDGATDEGCKDNACHHPGQTRPCYAGPKDTAGQGICQAGEQSCQESKETDAAGKKSYEWDTCVKQILPKNEETCNGVDDNCNGQTDEGLADCCLVGTQRPCGSGPTGCGASQEICTFTASTGQGAWTGCEGNKPPPKVDLCNGQDDDCDGKVDEDYPPVPCSTGLPGDCANGQEVCLGKAGTACLPVSKPGVEQCDGVDNDCNGKVDDFFAQRGQRCTVPNANGPCAVGVWVACVNGKPRCDAITKSTPELCGDGVDNDCDGKADKADSDCECNPGESGKCYPPADKTTLGKGDCTEGTYTCQASGKWGECKGATVPAEEICNGKDDNCDGNVDEAFPQRGQLCSTFKMGPCAQGQLQKCGTAAQGYTPQCVPIFVAANKEVCHNGIDDNCNGVIDEFPTCDCTTTSKTSQACSQAPSGLSGVGTCKRGTQTCGTNGVWSGCIGDVDPTPETCDGLDNNCDGSVDERDSNLGKPCVVTGKTGVCRAGTQACTAGKITCTSKVTPAATETCNNLDDDCNGSVDDKVPDSGKPCAASGKNGACSAGKLDCTAGKLVCTPSTTSTPEICNGIDDDCDGTIDNKLNAPLCETTPRPGICATATKICGGQLGWLDCQTGDYFRNDSNYERQETKCDGKDNDCDGKVDNKADGTPLNRTCYASPDGTAGPPGTQGIGDCKAGAQTCNAGNWSNCIGVVIPQRPNCTTTGDADCNGQIDKEEPSCGCWGSGSDGVLTVKGRIELDKVKGSELSRTPASTRVSPDIVTYQVTAIDKSKLTLKQKPDGLAAGDEILLIHLQGDASRLGYYELRLISVVDGNALTLGQAPKETYGATDNTDLKDQLVVVVRVPHYKRVLIAPGGHLTVGQWSGGGGGILVFRAQEVVRIDAGGTISANNAGYHGGTGVKGNSGEARAGEGGSSWPNDKTGSNGGGSAGANTSQAASGGGGGYGDTGKPGRDALEATTAKGGSAYGPSDGFLSTRIFMGSGGGGGGADNTDKGKSDTNQSGDGGRGGGIVMIIAHTLNITGALHAKGADGANGKGIDGRIGAGGGGAGGSVYLQTHQLVRYQGGSLSAAGGTGGTGVAGAPTGAIHLPTARGGNGGIGRVHLQLQTLNGVAKATPDAFASWNTPAPTTQELNVVCQ